MKTDPPAPPVDWGAWSREAVAQMSSRTRALMERHSIPGGRYEWDMEKATFTIGDATFALTVVGTLAGGWFLWSWANDSLPSAAKGNIAAVRQFGIENDIMLLSEPAMHAGLADVKECVALAGRILNADGGWLEPKQGIFFVLHERT